MSLYKYEFPDFDLEVLPEIEGFGMLSCIIPNLIGD